MKKTIIFVLVILLISFVAAEDINNSVLLEKLNELEQKIDNVDNKVDNINTGINLIFDILGTVFSRISRLFAGWVLSSSPYPSDVSIEQGLNSIEGCYKSIFSYQDGIWKSYNPLRQTNSLNKLSPEYGYWIKINCSEINWQIVILKENCTNSFDDDLDENIDCNDSDCDSYPDCADKDGDGYPAETDCDDNNANVNPVAIEVCNGVDDDCDGASSDGSEDPQIGMACDGADSDLCKEGTRVCSAGALVCSDNTGSTVDICDGMDNDCDGASSDGSEDPQTGTACDGADSDLCQEGTRSCSAGALVCSDNTGSTLDICNGVNDDCDPASSDGSEDPQIGMACDGADSDLCKESTRVCSAGALVCTDNTGSTVDICNGVDDDCDPASADGLEDPQNGLPCDGADSDLCKEGTISCSAGALACSDNTGSTIEICNSLDDDCDGQIDEGC